MNIAVIIAGGSGQRMHQDIPKQFLHVDNKPIIIYTLEVFQRHPDIDAIEVVCLDGWHEVLKAYAEEHGIDKLKWITSGGASAQESIRNGVYNLIDKCSPDDIILIHDGIRPMVDELIISDCIDKCRTYGNGVTALPHNEHVFEAKDDISTAQYIPRERTRCVQTPQAYKYGKLLGAYEEAFRNGIGIYGASYVNTMMVDMGETLYFAVGSYKNIKLTTPDDIELFKALLHSKKDYWIK